MFTCEKCYEEFEYNSLFIRHCNKKRNCGTIENITNVFNAKIELIDNKINNITMKSFRSNDKCYFCNKIYSTKCNLQKHIKNICHIKKDLLATQEEIINKKNRVLKELHKQQEVKINNLQKKLNNLEKKICDYELDKTNFDKSKHEDNQTNKDNQTNITNIDNQTNITYQTINNNIVNNNLIVNINPLGKETLHHISLKDYKKYLNGFFPGFIEFIEKVHFDENTPENHNICITNIKSPFMNVYEDDKWLLKDRNEIIQDLMSKKYNLLVKKCDEFEESNQINNKIVENFREFEENYYDNEATRNTKKNILLMIYNNKNKVIDKIKQKNIKT